MQLPRGRSVCRGVHPAIYIASRFMWIFVAAAAVRVRRHSDTGPVHVQYPTPTDFDGGRRHYIL